MKRINLVLCSIALGVALSHGQVCCAQASSPDPSGPTDEGQPLRSIRQIRQFSRYEALRGLPVEIEGTVTYVDPVWSFIFIQDRDEAIFVHGEKDELIQPGQRVRVQGKTSYEFQSFISATSVDEIKSGDPLIPSARDVSVLTPHSDCQLVRCELEIESALMLEWRSLLCGRIDGQRAFVSFPQLNAESTFEMVGTKLQVSGVQGLLVEAPAFYKPGHPRREPIVLGPQILLQDATDHSQIRAVSKRRSPETVKATIESVSPDTMGKRFRLHGQITYLDAHSFVLEADYRGIRIEADCTHGLTVGQTIETWIDHRQDEHPSPNLRAVFIRPMFTSPLPQPNLTHALDARERLPNCSRVTLEGTVKSFTESRNQVRIEVEENGILFCVQLETDGSPNKNLNLGSARSIRFTGTVLPISEEMAHQRSEFLIASKKLEDLVVTSRRQSFPWRSCAIAAVVLLGLCAVAYVWIRSLRFLVEEKTQRLTELNAFFRTSYESLGDAMVAEDATGTIVASNSRFASAFPRSPIDTSEGSRVEEIVRPLTSSKAFDNFLRITREAPRGHHTFEFSTVEDQPKSYFLSTAPIIDDSTTDRGSKGVILGRVWLFRDETERKRLESILLQAQKMEAVGTLASGFAHDVNNTLCAIANLLTAVGLDPLNELQRESLEIANENVFRAAEIIRKLLTFSGRQRLHRQLVSVNEIVQDSCVLFRHLFDHSIHFELQLAEDAGFAELDRTLIEQVLMNLCVNAREAMKENGGHIILKTWPVDPTNDRRVLISVSDDGCGMTHEVRKRIFDPYFSTKHASGGSGLGLAISYTIVSQHGGSIRCESSHGNGTVMYVSLPIQNEFAETDDVQSADNPVQSTRGAECLKLERSAGSI